MGSHEPARLDDGDSPRVASGWSFAAADVAPSAVVAGVPARRVLFLDDDPARAAVFLAEIPDAVWVQTAAECLERLQESWDAVHLDHDLGGRTHVDMATDDCGMEVIRWLCREYRPHVAQTLFLVHTHNLLAGLFMVLQMRERGYRAEFRPFGDDLGRLLKHDDDDVEETAQPLAPPPQPVVSAPMGFWQRLRRWLPSRARS